MGLARIANWTCGALLLLAIFGFLVFLPENIADYAREPEDVWLSVGWIIGLSLLAALCFVNAARALKPETTAVTWLTAGNVAVLIALGTLKALDTAYGAYDDPVLTALIALCALGPASALAAALQVSLAERR